MHAVVFQVDMKQDWEGDQQEELDTLTRLVKSAPGFVRGTWLTDGKRGLSLILFESEQAARDVADNASLPPTASATFRSADVYEVLRDV